MRDTNIVVLVGRLTRDVERPQGNGPAHFTLAVNRPKKQGDTWTDEASFIDCDYWHKSALDFLVKGKQIAISGEIQQQRWEKDGQQRSKIVIVANDVQILGGGNAGQGEARGPSEASRPAPRPSGAAKSAQAPAHPDLDDDFTDDIPF